MVKGDLVWAHIRGEDYAAKVVKVTGTVALIQLEGGGRYHIALVDCRPRVVTNWLPGSRKVKNV